MLYLKKINITKIKILSSVTKIGQFAFLQCSLRGLFSGAGWDVSPNKVFARANDHFSMKIKLESDHFQINFSFLFLII